METPKKVERWSYPFKPRAGSDHNDPQHYYEALAKADGGFFPIAGNGLWHGGVHFDEGTAAFLDQSDVRCIADGEVVAYRIDEQYPCVRYGDGGTSARYSTGFVLVRHRLELLPLPSASPASESSEEPALIFYSLYMHLLDWQGYRENPRLQRPGFWNGDTYAVKLDVRDSVRGWRVRAEPNGTVLGVLPRGTQVEGGEWHGRWRRFVRATPAVPGLAENAGYFYADRSALKGLDDDRYLVGPDADDPVEPSRVGLNVRAEASARSDILAVLPAGSRVRIAPTATASQYHKLLEVLAGEAVPALDADRLAGQGYVWLPSLEALAEPGAMGGVVALDPPLPIEAGALIGHLGHYQAYSHSRPQSMLHLEVFSCQDVEAFVVQSRAHAARLPDSAKTLLKIPAGTKLIVRDDVTPDNPPQISDPGLPTGHDMIFPLAVLEALPSERKLRVTDTLGGAVHIRQWWKLERMPGPDGNEIGGWLCEIDPITTRHSPWEWEGFDFIRETSTLGDQYASHLNAQAQLDDDEQARYRTQIDAGDSGPVKERLYDLIDLDRDQKLTPKEIRTALEKPWIAQSLGRLIAQYESEWYDDGTMSKWNALDGYMNEAGMADWEQEKSRIHTLKWWDRLLREYGIPEPGFAYHFHVATLIATMIRDEAIICKTCKKEIPITLDFLRKIAHPDARQEDLINISAAAKKLFKKYGVNSCKQVIHLLAQGKKETKGFTAFRESLYYSSYSAESLYRMAPTAIDNGFNRKGIFFISSSEKMSYISKHLLKNDSGYAEHCFGSNEYPGKDYRGRGLMHLTHYNNYRECAIAIGKSIDSNPSLVQEDMEVAVETGLWFWMSRKLGAIAESQSITDEKAVQKITHIVNGGEVGLADRKKYMKEIKAELELAIGECEK